MTCLGVLDRGERGDDIGTSLKEEGLIEMSTTVLHSRAALSLEYLPCLIPGGSFSLETAGIVGRSESLALRGEN